MTSRSRKHRQTTTRKRTRAQEPTQTKPTKEFAKGGIVPKEKRADALPTTERPQSAPKQPSAGSIARRKAGLIDELRSQDVTPERQSEIRQELAQEPLASAPILSYRELQRLGS